MILKIIIGCIYYYSGAFYVLRFINNCLGRRLTIVTYHRLTDTPLDQITYSLPYLFVTEETFERHLDFFKKHYTIINFSDINQYKYTKRLPPNSLIITFDDGYEDNFTRAYPILKKHDVVSTIFLATGLLNTKQIAWWDEVFSRLCELGKLEREGHLPKLDESLSKIYNEFKINPSALFSNLNIWEQSEIQTIINLLTEHTRLSDKILLSENRFLTWQQVIDMHDIVNFGAHSHSHVSLNTLTTEEIEYEVSESKTAIESRLGKEVICFSYPAGHYRSDMKHLLKKTGYHFAVTTQKGINNLSDTFALKRINLWEGSANLSNGMFSRSLFALKLSGL